MNLSDPHNLILPSVWDTASLYLLNRPFFRATSPLSNLIFGVFCIYLGRMLLGEEAAAIGANSSARFFDIRSFSVVLQKKIRYIFASAIETLR